MKIVSWNSQGGFEIQYKNKKILSFEPDIAVIQDCLHPNKLQRTIDFQDAVWVGDKIGKGLCVLSFSKEYKLSKLEEELKYEWIVPLKVSGTADFVLLAVWARRMPGYSYGKLVYNALKEYEHFIREGQVIIIGDFNVDKKVPSSYSGINGKRGFDSLMELLVSFGVKSCYHYFNNEDYGKESQANYFHYGKKDRPFHVHYCFVSQNLLNDTKQFSIGDDEEWLETSNHMPLILETEIKSNKVNTELDKVKLDITPEILKDKFNHIINNEITTALEIDKAVRYIKALRIIQKEETR